MSNRTQIYEAYLKSPEWHSLRKSAFARAGFRCEFCRAAQNLSGHHLNYRNLTDCTVEDIMALCEPCHDRWHQFHSSGVIATREAVMVFLTNPTRKRKVKGPPTVRKASKDHRKSGRTTFRSIRTAMRKLFNSDHTKQALDDFIREAQRMRPTLPERP